MDVERIIDDIEQLQEMFEAPGSSEFVTGEGFTVPDVEVFYRDMSAKGVLFSMPPKKQDFGGVLAQFVDSEGAHCSVGAEAA
jgi:uncharacterized glyoxalase superfamily protein PhnB